MIQLVLWRQPPLGAFFSWFMVNIVISCIAQTFLEQNIGQSKYNTSLQQLTVFTVLTVLYVVAISFSTVVECRVSSIINGYRCR